MNNKTIIGSFIAVILVFWFQVTDKYKKNKNWFDKIKLPLLIGSLVLYIYTCESGETIFKPDIIPGPAPF